LTLIDQRAPQSRNWTVRGDVTVIQSIEDADGLRCVDLIAHPDGTFAFKEFRRDPEDGGRWTLIADYSALNCVTKDEAWQRATVAIGWFKSPPTK
jgi:hypothetical protein